MTFFENAESQWLIDGDSQPTLQVPQAILVVHILHYILGRLAIL